MESEELYWVTTWSRQKQMLKNKDLSKIQWKWIPTIPKLIGHTENSDKHLEPINKIGEISSYQFNSTTERNKLNCCE